MAQRLKTVEYAFPFSSLITAAAASVTAGAFVVGQGYTITAIGTTDFTLIGASSNTVGVKFTATGVGAGTGTALPTRIFSNITVDIPETTTRTFRSVILEITCFDAATVAASATTFQSDISISGTILAAASIAATITNSGENQSFIFTRDVTAAFVSNFTTGSHVIGTSCQIAGIATQNASAKLIITYEYDDSAAATRIKTVKIPIDGATTNLTTTFANVGGVASQIPNLSTFLPEASKTYKSIFFEWITHTGTTAAAGSTLDISYDGGTTTVSDLTHAATLNSDVWYKRIDVLTGTLNTAAAASVQAKVTSTTGKPCPCLCGWLTVTYTYDHSASTRIINSIQMAIMDENALSGGITTADKSRWERTISVQEPGTITLLQSAVMASFIGSGALTLDLRVGAQASRTFTHAATARSGSVTAMRRIDSGAAGGAGITLTNGYNDLVIDWFTSAATLGAIASNMSGTLILNYTSDKHADGDAVHNHTTQWAICTYDRAASFVVANGNRIQIAAANIKTPIIPETNYWLAGMAYQVYLQPFGTAAGNIALGLLGKVQATEAALAGWRSFYSAMYESDAEVAPSLMYGRARDDFKRWPQDPDTDRLDPETARDFRFDNNLVVSATNGVIWQAINMLTYHSIAPISTVNILDKVSTGAMELHIYRAIDGLQIYGEVVPNGSTSRTFPWYDTSQELFAVAYDPTSNTSASSWYFFAGNTTSVDFSTAVAGGPAATYYAYSS